MFDALHRINHRPHPFEFYTTRELWDDEYISARLLEFHLRDDVDAASRRPAFIDASVAWMTGRFGIGPGTRIADFGCGPGLYANRLARLGARVTGIDFSRRSIAYARETARQAGLNVDYILADYLDYDTTERFDLIVMIFCDFCVLNPAQRRTMLDKFRGLLKENGHILLDVCSMNTFRAKTEGATVAWRLMDGFWSPGDYFGFLNTHLYDAERVILEKYTIVEPERTREIYNWLQCYTRESLREEFAAAGLSIPEFHSNVAGTPYRDDAFEIGIVAAKQL